MIKGYIEESIALKQNILRDEALLALVRKSIELLHACLAGGNKILIAGNGGSAADSQHFAAELTGRFKKERKAYPALALTTDTSFLTAWSNDTSFETIFSRQIEAFGKPNDVFFGISTSGNSKNIIEAIAAAKKIGMKTICLLGRDGGKTKDLPDISIIIPSNNTPRIQEIHIMLIHIICEELENILT